MPEQDLLIPAQDLRRLLAAACGEASLLYLYLHSGGSMDAAGSKLGFSPRQLDYAAASLRQLGLFPQPAARHLEPGEAPVYTEADLKQEYSRDPEFPNLVGEAQRRMGRVFSTEELKILLCLYRYLGLPAEVISILIYYCIEKNRARGASRLPSIRTVEREGYRWADMGIDNMEQAAAYMQSQLRLQTQIGRIRGILQLEQRRLTPGEEKYVQTWLEWGFGEAEIRSAYEKTCMNTGGLKWPYLHSILKSWQQQGLMTLAQIQSGDHPAQPRQERPGQRVQRHDDELSQFEKDAIARLMEEEG